MNTNEMENGVVTEETTNSTQDNIQAIKVNTKPTVVERFKGLKTWQKVLIGGAAATGLVLGGRAIVKVVVKKPEVVKEAVEKVAEVVTESPEVVVDTVAEVVTE